MRPLTYWQNWGYQLTHPWHWLTYGNNAGAVATVAAIIAGWLAWKSHKSTAAQLNILREQFFDASVPHVVIKHLSFGVDITFGVKIRVDFTDATDTALTQEFEYSVTCDATDCWTRTVRNAGPAID